MSHFTGPGYDFTLDIPEGWRLITQEEHSRYTRATSLLSDLDRCEHGRHAGDVCSGQRGCDGPSHGNDFLPPGVRIGTDLSGNPIVVPDSMTTDGRRRDIGDPSLWTPS